MRRLYLVRHAKAGDRSRYDGDDLERPLSRPGLKQAQGLVEVLGPGETPPERLFSSPAARCHQTVEPLATALGLKIEEEEYLVEGSDPVAALGRLTAIDNEVLAACTHGDVIWGILEWLARGGVALGVRPDAQKASVWILDWPDAPAEGVPVRATYRPPPVIA